MLKYKVNVSTNVYMSSRNIARCLILTAAFISIDTLCKLILFAFTMKGVAVQRNEDCACTLKDVVEL